MKKSFLLAFGLLSMGAFAQLSNQTNIFPLNGNTGIGNATPNYSLEVTQTSSVSGTVTHAFFGSRVRDRTQALIYKGIHIRQDSNSGQVGYGNYSYISGSTITPAILYNIIFNTPATANTPTGAFSFQYLGNERMRINQNGKVRISSTDIATPDGYRLFVEDGILTEKVKVAVEGTANWADYVFADNYNLMPLNEVEAFTKENKHLPNVPSAEEMVTEGLDVAQMDAKLLEKIEELTLYLIEQNKQIEELKTEIKELKKQGEK
ncbi:hypothetical protein V1389_14800 [Flavobacterium rakeshii]|uniref:hypothetical protein n=1 Tax=Flavobacterium rakeshii TaxID=1038845 RepID=UPI002E7B3C48|nr:hypothetical protein [Flavobacterium rakeshii]MEE1899615.1 hypothetical protein [Flavobacterium rakeshii]